jgi:hypothetical protein
MEKDYMRLETKLDFQKTQLLQWPTRLKFFEHQNYDKRLDDPGLHPIIQQGLICIHQLFQDGHKLGHRYGVRSAQENEIFEPTSAVSGRLISLFRAKSQLLRFWRESQLQSLELDFAQPYQLPSRDYLDGFDKIKWVIKDKLEVECLVRELSNLITGLDDTVPPQQVDNLGYAVLKKDIRDLCNIGLLNMVLNASTDDDNDLANIIDDAIGRKCTQLMLKCLWFRLIDDRKTAFLKSILGLFDGLSTHHPP